MTHAAEFPSFHIDESAAPLILVTFPDVATVEEIPALFEAYRRIAAQHPRVAWVVDLRRFNPILAPAKARRAFADNFEQSRAIIESSAVCEARVIESAIMRGVVTALDWLIGHKYPRRTFATLIAAKDWARTMLGPSAR